MLVENWQFTTTAIWLGTCDRDAEAEQTYHIGKNGKKSQLEKDLGWKIDYDWFLYQTTENDEILPIEALVKTLNISAEDDELLIETAKQKGVFEGNRMFSYNIAKFTEEETNKSYCGLKFIGNFEMLK